MSRASNVRAVARTLAAMRDTGKLERCDDALVALVRTTARALDTAEPGTNEHSAAARVHHNAINELRKLERSDASADIITRLTVPPAVGDGTNG